MQHAAGCVGRCMNTKEAPGAPRLPRSLSLSLSLLEGRVGYLSSWVGILGPLCRFRNAGWLQAILRIAQPARGMRARHSRGSSLFFSVEIVGRINLVICERRGGPPSKGRRNREFSARERLHFCSKFVPNAWGKGGFCDEVRLRALGRKPARRLTLFFFYVYRYTVCI